MMAQQAKISVVIIFLSGLLSMNAQAIDVNFTANLIQNPPCDVSGPDGPDQPIKIPVGEIGINKINGVNYQQDFTLTLSCGIGLGNSVALYLEYRGMPADFDENALQANQSGLGIRLYNQGKLMPINNGLAITMSDNGVTMLPLSAVPVRDSDPAVTLYEGDMTATASVEINYP